MPLRRVKAEADVTRTSSLFPFVFSVSATLTDVLSLKLGDVPTDVVPPALKVP